MGINASSECIKFCENLGEYQVMTLLLSHFKIFEDDDIDVVK